MKILITGTNGYIGKSLYNALKDEHNVTGLTRNDFDLTDSSETFNFFIDKYFDVVIHCAVVGGSRLKMDDNDVLDNNLKMYYNLLNNKYHFNKLIHLGSGAEIHQQNTLYGLSKHVIRTSLLNQDNCHNLRIFAVFDENELETRFIKTNIKKYLNKQPIEIFHNKKMDFFYMEDLVMLIKFCIFNDNLPKEINCNYNYAPHMLDIADIINGLDSHKIDIKMLDVKNIPQKTFVENYSGYFTDLGINYIGLEQGIKNVYNKLKNEH
jgi:nucleoside-diphosphate-sugar epimerase